MPVSEGAERQDEESTDNLGRKLRRAREAQGLSLDSVASELRIGAHLLGALEECRFESLDAPVFAKGYLKQYAARLGLDVAELAAEFDRSAGASAMEIELPASIKLRDHRQIRFWIAAGIGLTLVAAVLGAWWWLGLDSLSTPAVEVPAQSERVPTPEPLTDDVTEEAARATRAPQTQASDDEAAVSEVTRIEPRATAAEPASRASDFEVAEPSQSERPEAISESIAEPGAIDTGTTEVVSVAGGPVLEIIFNEDSWAEVTNSSGQRLYYNLGRSGTRARVAFNGPLNLFFGYAAGVELTIDGEPVPIPASAIRGDLAQFDLDPTGNPDP